MYVTKYNDTRVKRKRRCRSYIRSHDCRFDIFIIAYGGFFFQHQENVCTLVQPDSNIVGKRSRLGDVHAVRVKPESNTTTSFCQFYNRLSQDRPNTSTPRQIVAIGDTLRPQATHNMILAMRCRCSCMYRNSGHSKSQNDRSIDNTRAKKSMAARPTRLHASYQDFPRHCNTRLKFLLASARYCGPICTIQSLHTR